MKTSELIHRNVRVNRTHVPNKATSERNGRVELNVTCFNNSGVSEQVTPESLHHYIRRFNGARTYLFKRRKDASKLQSRARTRTLSPTKQRF